MEKLHIGFMKDLRNWEFHSLYKHIIDKMDRQQLEEGNIKQSFERVKSHTPNFHHALTRRGKNEYSVANQELTRLRTNYLISLRKGVESNMLTYLPKRRDAANIIHNVLAGYGKEYYVPSISTQANLVDDLVAYIDRSENFRDALMLLDLMDLMNEIVRISDEIMHNLGQRIITNGERKSRRAGVRKTAYEDLKTMIEVINAYRRVNRYDEEKSEKVESLMEDIDSCLKVFRTQLRSRATKSKNKKAIDSAVQELTKRESAHLSATLKNPPSATDRNLQTTSHKSPSSTRRSVKASKGFRFLKEALNISIKNGASGASDRKPTITKKGSATNFKHTTSANNKKPRDGGDWVFVSNGSK